MKAKKWKIISWFNWKSFSPLVYIAHYKHFDIIEFNKTFILSVRRRISAQRRWLKKKENRTHFRPHTNICGMKTNTRVNRMWSWRIFHNFVLVRTKLFNFNLALSAVNSNIVFPLKSQRNVKRHFFPSSDFNVWNLIKWKTQKPNRTSGKNT